MTIFKFECVGDGEREYVCICMSSLSFPPLPSRSFPPLFVTGPNSGQWLRDAMAKAWSGWLPSDALDTIKKWVDAYKHTHKSGMAVV